MNKEELARFAINFIIENAQPTTGINFAVFGTIDPKTLNEIVRSAPDGVEKFDAAKAQRGDPRNRKD